MRYFICILILLIPATCHSWTSSEHQEIGEEGYRMACKQARKHATSFTTSFTLKYIVCDDIDTRAKAFGQMCAIAGDYLDDPEKFLNPEGGHDVRNIVKYGLAALRNATHFHPIAPHKWRNHHGDALDIAAESHELDLLRRHGAFNEVLLHEAFAIHFLQDAFSSGHMGVNREASSVSAVMAYHNKRNELGQLVRNTANMMWKAYGDGYLNHPNHGFGRELVIRATATSLLSVFMSYMGAEKIPTDLFVWASIPNASASGPLSLQESLFNKPPRVYNGRRMVRSVLDYTLLPKELHSQVFQPLTTFGRPARPALTLDSWVTAAGNDLNLITSGLIGLSISWPWLTEQDFAPRYYLGLGAIGYDTDDRGTLAVDSGFIVPIGTSLHGLISHEVQLGGIAHLIGDKQPVFAYGAYRLGLELGNYVLRVGAGPSAALNIDGSRLGFYSAISIGYTYAANGGGTISGLGF